MSVDIRLVRWPNEDRVEFERLAAALARVKAAARESAAGFARHDVPTGPEEPSDRERAKALIAQRRARDAAAGADRDLFSEPSWDIMLLVFVAHEEGVRLDIDGIARDVGCSSRTAARWVGALEHRGLVSNAAGIVGITAPGGAFVLRCLQAI